MTKIVKQPKASLIIRTRNEEQWITHCLDMVYSQTIKDVEVVIVDNHSTDNTLSLARQYPVKIVMLDEYRPGWSLNEGIRASSGEFIVCLSAHCIPKHNQWLENLLRNFDDSDLNVAGVYGRQIPFKYSADVDKRDLIITFGLDRRVQHKDTFFHNANSVLLRDLWEKFPFDEEVTNIEDRVWAQQVIEAGYQIVYEPEAEVFHCHGIHHANAKQRSQQTVRIMENLHVEFKGDIPDTFKPGQLKAVAFVPVIGDVKSVGDVNLLERTIGQLQACQYVKDVVVVSENADVLTQAKAWGVRVIARPKDLMKKGKSVEDTLQYALAVYEQDVQSTDAVISVNYLFPFRPEKFFNDLIEQYAYSGVESTIAALKNYRVFWVQGEEGYQSFGEDFKPRDERDPVYEGLIGLGVITSSRLIRSGHLLGKQVELLNIDDSQYAIKYGDECSQEIIRFFLQKEAVVDQAQKFKQQVRS